MMKGALNIWWLILIVLLYVSALVVGAIKIQWNFYLFSYNNSPRNTGQIALTFDDGPNKETKGILDILKKESVEAAFFCIGKHVSKNPELVRRMSVEGHLVGNHSNAHSTFYDLKSAGSIKKDIELCNDAVYGIINHRPLLFRPPYGVTNPNIRNAVRRSGMLSVGWSVRSFDTVAKDKHKLLGRILDNMKSGDIILLHDSMAITREILTELIHSAQKKGYTFVRVDKLLNVEAYT